MGVVVALLAVAITGVGLLLAIVSTLAAVRTRAARFGFAALAFLVFAGRGLAVILDGEGLVETPLSTSGWVVGLDAVTLALLYFAIVKG